jgi:hypothetical protein
MKRRQFLQQASALSALPFLGIGGRACAEGSVAATEIGGRSDAVSRHAWSHAPNNARCHAVCILNFFAPRA